MGNTVYAGVNRGESDGLSNTGITVPNKPIVDESSISGQFLRQPHELTTDWGDHTRSRDYLDTVDGRNPSKFDPHMTVWGNNAACSTAVVFLGDQYARGGACGPNEDGTFREEEVAAHYFRFDTQKTKGEWSSDPVGVNQDPNKNPWGAKSPIECGCMPYATDSEGHKEYACPIEFIAHGFDFEDISENVKASVDASGTYDRSKQKKLPCPKGYIWVENGGIHYVDPNGRIPATNMLAMICREDKTLFDPTVPVKPGPDDPIYNNNTNTDQPLPPVIGASCSAFLKSQGIQDVTCPGDGLLPDPETALGKKWWENYDQQRIKQKADEEGQNDANGINQFLYSPNYYLIGGGIAASLALYLNAPTYNYTIFAPAFLGVAGDWSYQYMNYKLWRAEDELAKLATYVEAGSIVAAGFLAPPILENAIGLPQEIMGTVNLASGAIGLLGGAAWLLYKNGLPSLF